MITESMECAPLIKRFELDPFDSLMSVSVFEVNFLTFLQNLLLRVGEMSCSRVLRASPAVLAAIKVASRGLIGAWTLSNVCAFRLACTDRLMEATSNMRDFPKTGNPAYASCLCFARVYLLLVRDYARISTQHAVSHFLVRPEFARMIGNMDPLGIEHLLLTCEKDLLFEMTGSEESFLEIRSEYLNSDSKERLSCARVVLEKEAESHFCSTFHGNKETRL